MPGGKVQWRRAEFALTLFACVGFVTLLIRVTTIWGGLPAHPLFLHLPVVLIPLTVLGALACTARPVLLDRYGTLLCAVAIVGMSSTFLTMEAGGALSSALHLQGQEAHLISEHAAAAKVLAIAFTLLTAVLILTFASHRIAGGLPIGIPALDGLLSSRVVLIVLRGLLVILALVAAFYVFRVGDLGARAVWAGRLQAAQATPPR